jgi:hypothetical protein
MSVAIAKLGYRESYLQAWENLIREIFPAIVPQSCLWTNLDDIVAILNIVGKYPDSNHTFMPDGGGLDLRGAQEALEMGCIELVYDHSWDVVKPKGLYFESFGNDSQWAYFRLETGGLRSIESEGNGICGEVTDLGGGHYVNVAFWDVNEYEGKPLPQGSRRITRYFGGAFVVFGKGSVYNRLNSTYDARHNQMTKEEFRTYIGAASEFHQIR